MNAERTAYDQKMDDMLRRMSDECDGEDIGDVMNVCAVMIGLGLRTVPPEMRESVIANLLGFARETCSGETESMQQH